ncbi:MAG: conjugal transfer protein TraF [Vicinamibacterales bacterium]
MQICRVLTIAAATAVSLGLPGLASAQTFESVGGRAQAMSGAFVAVANDATASWWNPAGLAQGEYLSAVIEKGRMTEPAEPSLDAPALRTSFNNFALAFPALGLSYYHLRISATAPPDSTGTNGPNRQDPRTAGTSVRSVVISQLGTTIGQSIGDYLVVGATLKVMRAGAVSGTSTDAVPIDAADGLSPSHKTKGDLDLGAMATLGRLRLGLAVKNVTEPTFDAASSDSLTLRRQARAGIALTSRKHVIRQGITVAADADLTTTATPVGDVRHVAAGVESWTARGRVALRAGASANTVGERRPAGSVGVGVALTRALYVNASRVVGRDKSVTGWSTGVNVAF